MRQRLTLLVFLLLIVLATPTAFAQESDQVAFVIGNAAYPDAEAPLKEPLSNARDLGDALKRLGYDVEVGQNLKKEAMRQALERFYGKLKSTSTALFFFSGFGIQSDRQSYIIPVDAQIWNEGDVRRDGFSIDKVIGEMTSHGAHVKIVIIDASRRNPFERRFRSVSEGLAAVTAPRGTVVMSSAPPETVASESSSPVFVPELIKEIEVRDARIEDVFNRTRVDVSRATKGQQVPWFSSSLEEDYAFAPGSQRVEPAPHASAPIPAPPAKPASPAPNTGTAARQDYITAQDEGTIAAWDDFIRKHPKGDYSDLARKQREKLLEKSAERPIKEEEKGTHERAPDNLADFYRRGQRYALNGDFDHAIEDFSEVIRRDPKHAGALNDRCWARGVIGDLYDAIKDCDQALEIAPNYMDAFDSRGMVNLKLGNLDKSIADYDAALRIDPKHASSLYGRGIAKRRNGNAADGRKDIEAAKEIQPNIADEFAGYGIR